MAPHLSPISQQGGVLQHQSTHKLWGWSLLPNWELASWKIIGGPSAWGSLHCKTPSGPTAPGALLDGEAIASFPQILEPAGSRVFGLATPKQRMGRRGEGEAGVGVLGAGLQGAPGRAGQPHASSHFCLPPRPLPPPPPKHLTPIFLHLALVSYPHPSPLAHPYPSLEIFKEKREGEGGRKVATMKFSWGIIGV